MPDLAGFGLATLALVLFGVYMVPRKLTRLPDIPFSLTMCAGVVLTTTLANLLVHGRVLGPATAREAWLGLVCGPIWYLGVLAYAVSVTRMGLTISTPIKNTTAVLGTVIGLVVFAEWQETRPLPAIAGSLLVVVCAVVLGRVSDHGDRRSRVTTGGVVAAIAAAVFFAAYTIPFRIAQRSGLDTPALVAYMGIGTLGGALGCFAVMDRDWAGWWRAGRRDHLHAALCGVLWVLAVMAMAEAINRIGLAIVWPYTNLNMIFTIGCAIVFFHEVDIARHGKTVALGLAAGVLGVALLAVARL